MADSVKALKIILVVYGLLFLVIWGLIPFIGTMRTAQFFGFESALNPNISKGVGWLGMTIGLLLLFASRDPIKNVLVINIMILANIIFVIFYFVEWIITQDMLEFIWLLNLIPGIIFLILMIIFRPQKA